MPIDLVKIKMVRIKKRFIIFQIQTSEENKTFCPNQQDIIQEIQFQFIKQYGLFGAGKSFFLFKMMFWKEEKRIGGFAFVFEKDQIEQVCFPNTYRLLFLFATNRPMYKKMRSCFYS